MHNKLKNSLFLKITLYCLHAAGVIFPFCFIIHIFCLFHIQKRASIILANMIKTCAIIQMDRNYFDVSVHVENKNLEQQYPTDLKDLSH